MMDRSLWEGMWINCFWCDFGVEEEEEEEEAVEDFDFRIWATVAVTISMVVFDISISSRCILG